MSFIEKYFFYCVLYSECPLSEVVLYIHFVCRKKLSKFSANPDWRNASNYVAKRYMKEAGRQVYFQDVKLQMDAKLWGEEYNKHRPPKKVLKYFLIHSLLSRLRSCKFSI